MATKRIMATKRSVTKRGKSLSFISQVKSLQSCVRQDLTKLARCYPKVLTDVDRAIKSVSLALKKAKTKTTGKKKAVGGKMAVAKSRAVANALQRELNSLRTEKLAIQASMRTFSSQRNALQQLEKTWSRKLKAIGSTSPRRSVGSRGKAGSRKLARGGLRPAASAAMLAGHHAWGLQ